MKLTKAEFTLLESLECVYDGELSISDLGKKSLVTAAWMAGKGLLRAREWDKGRVVPTALGKSSYARQALAVTRHEEKSHD